MILSYIKISLRNFRKRLLFTVINVVGLAIGIVSFLLLFGYIFFEKKFDDFHLNRDKIYRVNFERYKKEDELKLKYSNVMRFSVTWGGGVVRTEEFSMNQKIYYVDNDF